MAARPPRRYRAPMAIPAFPRRPFIFALACLTLAPVASRLAGVAEHGWKWVWGYLPLSILCSIFAAAPAITVTGLGQAERTRPAAYWTPLAVALAILLLAHAKMPVPVGDQPRSSMVFMMAAILATFAAAGAWAVVLLLLRLLRRS